MTTETASDTQDPKWPVVVSGDGFRIDGPPLPPSATEDAMRKAEYAYYDPERLPDGARIGWVWEYDARALTTTDADKRYGTYTDPDETVKAAYNEQDGVMYEFLSCESHAYASADEIEKSDLELFEEALDGIHIGGEETFRLRIEVEEHEPGFLGDRTVRCDFITQKAANETEAYEKLTERGVSGLGDLEPSPARKFDNYDIETETLQNPETHISYVWVHTEAGSDDTTILGRDRGDL